MDEFDSKYVIIKADTIEASNEILRTATISLGLSENNFKYLIGERNEGNIIGVEIKNNNVPVFINGFALYEIDKHIVEALDTWIELKVSQIVNVWYVSQNKVWDIIPNEVLI